MEERETEERMVRERLAIKERDKGDRVRARRGGLEKGEREVEGEVGVQRV